MLTLARLSARSAVSRRYGLAVLAVLISLGGMLALERFQLHNMSLFFLGIAVAAWYGGIGPAVLALLLTCFVFDYFFVEPLYTFHITSHGAVYVAIFVVFTIVITWFSVVRQGVEHQLRQSRDDLQKEVMIRSEQANLLDLTHDTIFVRDMDDVITYWNRGAQELYGWTAAEAIGQNAHLLLKPGFSIPLDELRAELLRSGHWQGELQTTRKDGGRVTVASRWSVRQDERGRPRAILETSNDISERKRREERVEALNEELAKRTAQLEVTNKELEAFTYSASHDLRAPVRHMLAYGALLQKRSESSLDETGRRYMTSILESGKRMSDLIDDLLNLSRIGRTDTRMTTVDLGQLLTEVVTELHDDIRDRDVEWRLRTLPSVYGDRSMLRLALVNLLSNAVKFTKTRPKAEIDVGCTNGPNGAVVIFIRDNGVGFNMKHVAKLFGVFQRLHPREAFEGTGIGLATVQRIINRHGGTVWAEGLTDAGATFYFSIPKRSDQPSQG